MDLERRREAISVLTRAGNIVFVDRGNKESCHGRKIEDGFHLGENHTSRGAVWAAWAVSSRTKHQPYLHMPTDKELKYCNFSLLIISLFLHCWASHHSQCFEDEDLGSSPGWWAATAATYCPSAPKHYRELPKSPNDGTHNSVGTILALNPRRYGFY